MTLGQLLWRGLYRGWARRARSKPESRRLRRIDEGLQHRLEELHAAQRPALGLAHDRRFHHRRIADDREKAAARGEPVEESLRNQRHRTGDDDDIESGIRER